MTLFILIISWLDTKYNHFIFDVLYKICLWIIIIYSAIEYCKLLG